MRIIIIGNGVAGTSCALALRGLSRDTHISLVSKESKFFYSRTALMYSFMDRMQRRDLEPFERSVYAKQRIELVHDTVTSVDFDKRHVVLQNSGPQSFDKLVLATGAIPNIVPWKGLEDLTAKHDGASRPDSGVVHLVSLQDLDACESLVPSTKHAVVVGGGLIGIELVECLMHHGVAVTFLIREDSFWPQALDTREGAWVADHMRQHGVDVRLGTAIDHVERDAAGRVSAVRPTKGDHIPCQMLGVCIGVKPNIGLLKTLPNGPRLGSGIVTDRYLETSRPGVFACGDCAEIHPAAASPKELESASLASGARINELNWYAAKRQGNLVAQNILGRRQAYSPPLFFNSSKFFDIEFTNIGYAQIDAQAHPATVLQCTKPRATLRIVHETQAPHRVLSFNALGARVDHALLSTWVEEGRGLNEVLERLPEAQFDVEFGRLPFERQTPIKDPPHRPLGSMGVAP
jgi:NADPH-dependent 2,4-dienoyl-CoA reductase/sulfur reductase-like enzyme